MGKTNIASGGFTPVQVGRVIPRDDSEQAEQPSTEDRASGGKVKNIRSGNAKVARQADVILGDLHIQM